MTSRWDSDHIDRIDHIDHAVHADRAEPEPAPEPEGFPRASRRARAAAECMSMLEDLEPFLESLDGIKAKLLTRRYGDGEATLITAWVVIGALSQAYDKRR